MTDLKPLKEADLARAVELVCAAYGDAMNRAGMLKGKIEEVHAYARDALAELDEHSAPDDE